MRSAPLGFYVVSTFLRLPPGAAASQLLPASERFCSRPWREVASAVGDAINAERYCTWGPYVSALLAQGLGIVDGRLRFGSGDVGWPMGAALVEASKLPGFMPKGPAGHKGQATARAGGLRARLLPGGWAWAVDAMVAVGAVVAS